MIINNKYKVEKFISKGAFGNVYKCSCNNKLYALKEENNYTTLKYEANIYKDLRKIKNISSIIDFFTFEEKYYIVLNLYEYNLVEYKNWFFDSKIYSEILTKIFTIIIKTISFIHDKGYVHRDLKPSNICLDKLNNPYIIDFGLSKKIIDNNKHIQEKKIHSVIGSLNFVSINVIELIEPTRRDDMETIIYILFYMILDNNIYIKYDKLEIEQKKRIEVINNIILNTGLDKEYKNIISTLSYIRKLNYSQKPNYEYICRLLFNKN